MRQGEAEAVVYDFQSPNVITLPRLEANESKLKVDIDFVLFLGLQADLASSEWVYDNTQVTVTSVGQTTQAVTVLVEPIADPPEGKAQVLQDLALRVTTTANEKTPPVRFRLPVVASLGAAVP